MMVERDFQEMCFYFAHSGSRQRRYTSELTQPKLKRTLSLPYPKLRAPDDNPEAEGMTDISFAQVIYFSPSKAKIKKKAHYLFVGVISIDYLGLKWFKQEKVWHIKDAIRCRGFLDTSNFLQNRKVEQNSSFSFGGETPTPQENGQERTFHAKLDTLVITCCLWDSATENNPTGSTCPLSAACSSHHGRAGSNSHYWGMTAEMSDTLSYIWYPMLWQAKAFIYQKEGEQRTPKPTPPCAAILINVPDTTEQLCSKWAEAFSGLLEGTNKALIKIWSKENHIYNT